MAATKAKSRISAFAHSITMRKAEVIAEGNEAWKGVFKGNEVKAVRKFLSDKGVGIDYLNRKLAPGISTDGRVVKFASVFVHGTPQVAGFTRKGSKQNQQGVCELGDLLSVFVYLDSDSSLEDARSVLFQAKRKPKAGSHVVGDKVQRDLYDSCDGFIYHSSTVQPKGTERDFPTGRGRGRGLQYLFVEPFPAQARPIPSDKDAAPFVTFGEHLLKLLTNKTGLKISTKKKSRSKWGGIVWDLLDFAASGAQSAGIARESALLGSNGLLKHFNSFEGKDTFHAEVGEEGDGGFGIVFIITWDGGLDPQSIVQPVAPFDDLLNELSHCTHPSERLKDLVSLAHEKFSNGELSEVELHNLQGLLEELAARGLGDEVNGLREEILHYNIQQETSEGEHLTITLE